MEAVAKLKNCQMSARKMRLVADLVRGLPVTDALNTLQFTKKEAASWIDQCLISAISNWENKTSEDSDDYGLFIKEIRIDQGSMLKRFRPAPHGRAHRIRKHSCHINIIVANKLATDGDQAEVSEIVEDSASDNQE